MSALNIEYLREYLQEVLPKHDGKLMTVSLSKNGKSAYVLIGFPELRYDVIRISNYKAYKTFLATLPSPFILKISPNSNWKFLSIYQNLIVWSSTIKITLSWSRLSVPQITIRHTLWTIVIFNFLVRKQELFFIKKSGFTKKKTHTSPLDEVVNQIFRKFYSDGLINTIEKGNGDIMVFVTALGMELLSTSEKNYQIRYLQDQCDINWKYITLPVSSWENGKLRRFHQKPIPRKDTFYWMPLIVKNDMKLKFV